MCSLRAAEREDESERNGYVGKLIKIGGDWGEEDRWEQSRRGEEDEREAAE